MDDILYKCPMCEVATIIETKDNVTKVYCKGTKPKEGEFNESKPSLIQVVDRQLGTVGYPDIFVSGMMRAKEREVKS